MNADAHQEAIPACATTWKRTRYLIQGAQPIGRRGGVLFTELDELAAELDAVLRKDEAFEGVLESEEEPSCAMVDIGGRMGRRGERRRRERRPIESFKWLPVHGVGQGEMVIALVLSFSTVTTTPIHT